MSVSKFFSQVAQWTSRESGRPLTFALAVGTILIWAASGPLFNYSDTWQLVINTGTTIVTFLMVFLIQNSQNRDTAAIHLKLDELIRVSTNARNKLLALEDLTEMELDQVKESFTRLAEQSDAASSETIKGIASGLDQAEEGIDTAKQAIAGAA
jgi:low affinity Fe/Cu permease